MTFLPLENFFSEFCVWCVFVRPLFPEDAVNGAERASVCAVRGPDIIPRRRSDVLPGHENQGISSRAAPGTRAFGRAGSPQESLV